MSRSTMNLRKETLELWVLILGAFLLFVAGASQLGLPALDDCFYARKGVEMARRGGFFTVTWAGTPTFQNPPLQISLLACSVGLFGENDFAMRWPSMLMAIGILLGLYRLGSILLDEAQGVSAVAWLTVTPFFVENARRVMMEIPLAFWIVVTLLVFLEGVRRPMLHALLAIPLGAALLTKSVLGLLPLLLMAAAVALCPSFRPSLRRGWIWFGVLAGLAIGATWPIHQWRTFGAEAIRAHVGEIWSRSTAGPSANSIADYPLILLTAFQPVLIPGLVGAVLLVKRWWRNRETQAILIAIAAILPPVLYNFSRVHSARYVFPILPALALGAAVATSSYLPAFDRVFRRVIAPALLVVCAMLFMWRPKLLKAERGTLPFKTQAGALATHVSRDEQIPYIGEHYWAIANPLLYYNECKLALPSPTITEAVLAACEGSHVLAADTNRLAEVTELGVVPVLLFGTNRVGFYQLEGCRAVQAAPHERVALERKATPVEAAAGQKEPSRAR